MSADHWERRRTNLVGRGWLLHPGVFLAAGLMALVTPVVLPFAWIADQFGGAQRSWCRGWWTLLGFVGVEAVVVSRASLVWLTGGGPLGARKEGFPRYGRLLKWWGVAMFRVLSGVNGLRVEV